MERTVSKWEFHVFIRGMFEGLLGIGVRGCVLEVYQGVLEGVC